MEEELAQDKVFCEAPRGMLIEAPSQSIVDLLEKRLGTDFAFVGVPFLQEHLTKLLIEDLHLVDEISIQEQSGAISVLMKGNSNSGVCDFVNKNTHLGHLGCPLCNAIALILSKITRKPIIIVQNTVSNSSVETKFATLEVQ